MSPGSSTESYSTFARIGLRESPGKNLNQVTCPDRDSNPGHLVSRPDARPLLHRTHFDIGCHARIPTRNTIFRWVASFRITGSTLKKKSTGRNSIALRLSEATVRSRALRLLSLGPFEGVLKPGDDVLLCSYALSARVCKHNIETDRFAVSSVFSNEAIDMTWIEAVKANMAQVILEANEGEEEKEEENQLKSYILQQNDFSSFTNIEFSSFVTPSTKIFFTRFSISIDFLNKDPSTWKDGPVYKKGTLFFQQDNHPIHTANRIQRWFTRRRDVHPVDWPPNSPDMNPIQNLWAAVKRILRSIWAEQPPVRTPEELWDRVLDAWEEMTKNLDLFHNLVDSMPRRMRAVASPVLPPFLSGGVADLCATRRSLTRELRSEDRLLKLAAAMRGKALMGLIPEWKKQANPPPIKSRLIPRDDTK
ncbi:hypothetical protein ANN_25069 [Periplaneta americana]|uniref:Tc1-like transposase DDE domain-containing protein n=1 Tax=Periplaneta americana TaxID=6978 RepID=A0ABQ8S0X4_PERAM|nr:hypothetical protein ANN_25069 [Periplaneta americana]